MQPKHIPASDAAISAQHRANLAALKATGNSLFDCLARDYGYLPGTLRRMIGDATNRAAIIRAISTETDVGFSSRYCVSDPQLAASLTDAFLSEIAGQQVAA